jgi:hypothetical protein
VNSWYGQLQQPSRRWMREEDSKHGHSTYRIIEGDGYSAKVYSSLRSNSDNVVGNRLRRKEFRSNNDGL